MAVGTTTRAAVAVGATRRRRRRRPRRRPAPPPPLPPIVFPVSTFPLVIAAISGAIGVALCIFCAPVLFYLVKKGYLRFYHWGSSGFKKAEAPRVVPTLKEIGGFVTGERIRAARRLKEAEAEAIRVAREVLAEEEAELAAEAAVAEAEAAEQRRQDEELAAAARRGGGDARAAGRRRRKMRRLAPARVELQRFMTELEERRIALAARREREAVRVQHRLDEAAARAAKRRRRREPRTCASASSKRLAPPSR